MNAARYALLCCAAKAAGGVTITATGRHARRDEPEERLNHSWLLREAADGSAMHSTKVHELLVSVIAAMQKRLKPLLEENAQLRSLNRLRPVERPPAKVKGKGQGKGKYHRDRLRPSTVSLKPYSKLHPSQKTERLKLIRVSSLQLGAAAGPSASDKDDMLAELCRMSTHPHQSESMDLITNKFYFSLLSLPAPRKKIEQIIAGETKQSALFAQIRMTAGNVPERGAHALQPFLRSFPNARTRRAAQNKALNALTSEVVRAGSLFSAAAAAAADGGAEAEAAQAAADAAAAHVEEGAEEHDADTLWTGNGRGDAVMGAAEDDALDELATAFPTNNGTAASPASEHVSFGLLEKNGAISFMSPLLMIDSCPTDGSNSRRGADHGDISSIMTFRSTCDAAVIPGTMIKQQKFCTCISQALGNGAPGAQLAQNQFRGSQSSNRAIVDRLGPGGDDLPWLTNNYLPYLRQIAISNRKTERGGEPSPPVPPAPAPPPPSPPPPPPPPPPLPSP